MAACVIPFSLPTFQLLDGCEVACVPSDIHGSKFTGGWEAGKWGGVGRERAGSMSLPWKLCPGAGKWCNTKVVL